jgi:hypothetical protein
MKITSAYVSICTDKDSLRPVCEKIRQDLGGTPSMLLVYYSEHCDGTILTAALNDNFPHVPVHGGTSCRGVMTDKGFHPSDNSANAALLAIYDPYGAYGCGAARLSESPRMAAAQALMCALENAQRMGEVPELVWLTAPPGKEEDLLQGIADVVGMYVPVAGGSSADDTIGGRWQQLANSETFNDAVVISVFFPTCDIAYAFHNGYFPTAHQGIVTHAQGRIIYTINDKPAAQVYNQWREGCLKDALIPDHNILNLTTLAPLGVCAGDINKQAYYLLIHPHSITPEGGLRLFAEVKCGDEIVLMQGSVNSLTQRAGRAAATAINSNELRTIHGALVIYCAGCMLAVREDMPTVVAGINVALADNPFLGAFTFGEQGCFMCGKNRHGNLMISVVVFGDAV